MAQDPGGWFRRDGEDWLLSLYLQPGARKTEVAGLHDGALKLRLAAPPVEGRANAALIGWLADWFGVPKNRVRIEGGELSRHKRVRVTGSGRSPGELLG
ncbi:DUF167 domain-containing protein [Chitinimonas koreensis]|uniref:DUF167 domain-containing protein n=1 Tax=Chitinimonas koreensis TaxID=356302 RepID=UPI0004246A2F|nr:DUF167 family protein [Chitinimonas koreensis]QNM95958.1 YggU family protein [Chitinimonas koreensis]